MKALLQIATLLRAGQLYNHHCHNNVAGATFFSDHEYFGEVYPALEGDYDGCIERYIGLCKMPADTVAIAANATDLISDMPLQPGEGNHNFFSASLKLEEALCKLLGDVCSSKIPEGTKQFLGDIADKSEKRQYFLTQRLK